MLTWRRLSHKTGTGRRARNGGSPFLDTYRTLCFAPPPEFERVLEKVRALGLAECRISLTSGRLASSTPDCQFRQ